MSEEIPRRAPDPKRRRGSPAADDETATGGREGEQNRKSPAAGAPAATQRTHQQKATVDERGDTPARPRPETAVRLTRSRRRDRNGWEGGRTKPEKPSRRRPRSDPAHPPAESHGG